MAEAFVFRRRARRPGALALAALALIALVFLIFGVEAHPVVIAVFAVLMSPALWEILKDAEARLTLDDRALAWESGSRRQNVELDKIDRVALRTTLDFSQRATVHLTDGRRLRIPAECIPGGRRFDDALKTRGVAHSRSLFGG